MDKDVKVYAVVIPVGTIVKYVLIGSCFCWACSKLVGNKTVKVSFGKKEAQ